MARRRAFGYVRKLPSGRFQAMYTGPDGLRRTAPGTFTTKTDAAQWLTRVEMTIVEGRWRDPVHGREEFGSYAERWIDERPNLRPRTVDLYRWTYQRHLALQLAGVRLEDMTPMVVRRWRAALLDAGVSTSMTAKAYRLLRAILNTAVDDDILDRSPCRIRGAGDEKPAERPILSVRQVQQLCMAVPPRFSAFIAVTTFASLRWGEVTALRRQDVDLAAGLVTVRAAWVERSDGSLELGPPKSHAGLRRVAIPEPVTAMLAAHLQAYVPDAPAALVFATVNGRPLRRSNFNKSVNWAKLVNDLGVPRLHLHDLRHTGNTLAASTPGASTRDLMQRMGHDDMRAALIYQHITAGADRRIADALRGGIEDAQAAEKPAEVLRLSARGAHDGARPTRRRKVRTTRSPANAYLFDGAGDENRTRTVSLGS